MKRLLPRTVPGQLVAFSLAALLISQLAMLAITAAEKQDEAREWWTGYVLARIASVVELLDRTPDTLHQHVLNASDMENLTLSIEGPPQEIADTDEDSAVYQLELQSLVNRPLEKIVVSVNELSWLELLQRRFSSAGSAEKVEPEPWLEAAIFLRDDRWLQVEVNPPLNLPSTAVFLVPAATMLIVFGTMLFFLTRHISRPIQSLAHAAEAFGRGDADQPVPVSGPAEIRQAIEAFNAMRERLTRFVLDRTKMLAAVGHDLRTPITTMRLRAEFIEDDEIRLKMLASLDEIQQMAEAALSFAREEAISEPVQTVDLNALVQTVCTDQVDIDRDVDYREIGTMPYRCRANSLKRAVRNIVENAVIHGKRARVTLNGPGDEAWIMVEDDGPGIPEDHMQQIFRPFVRMDTARSTETGGIGLGLAIARSIVRGHGGDITVENREEGGLRATIKLPGVS
ncbi:MAG TPA: ATP-binding protein [Hyphomicrobiales bacterium]|nr:ATP-binding protein [Hyphomicrobiales bacterium]